MSTRMRPSRFSLRHSVVRSSGWRAASTAPISPANARTTSWRARRRSGVHTWIPFDPVTCANGVRPSSRRRSPVLRAARRTAPKSLPGAGSRSITMRSGCHSLSARESQTWGVIVFWFNEVEQRVEPGRDHVRDRAARLRHLHALDPAREVVRDVLVEEPLALDPVGEPLHAHRAGAHVREHPFGHPLVVGREVRLRDPVVREQHLLRVRQRDRVQDGTSRTTSAAGLSSRSPM